MNTMQASNRLQKALKQGGGSSFGVWLMLAGSNLARILASSGADWVLIDTEHGNIDDGEMHDAVTAVAACSVSPIVRIADNQPFLVKRALDSGAHGIMVPLLKTVADAQRLASAAKFPPLGTRGFGSPFAQMHWPGIKTGVEYLQQANAALLTIVQIETKEALQNIDAIAATDGIDVLFVGPFDLGNNIGHPILGAMDQELKDAIVLVHAAAVKAGKKSGIYCTSGTQAKEYADKGFHMISVTGDVAALQSYCSQEVNIAKGITASKATDNKPSGPYGR